MTSINTAFPYLKPIHVYPKYSWARSTHYPWLPVPEHKPYCTALAGPCKTHCQLSSPGYLATQTTTHWFPVPLRTRHKYELKSRSSGFLALLQTTAQTIPTHSTQLNRPLSFTVRNHQQKTSMGPHTFFDLVDGVGHKNHNDTHRNRCNS